MNSYDFQISAYAPRDVDVWTRASCPFCTPSRKNKRVKDLSVTRHKDDSVGYLCHHCGVQGIVTNKPQREKTRVAPVTPAEIASTLPPALVSFLDGRKISPHIAEAWGIKIEKQYIPAMGTYTDCIAFPHTVKGSVTSVKYRATDYKGFACKGAPVAFYGIDKVTMPDRGGSMTICEGELDCLSLAQVGIENPVSVPNGAGGLTVSPEGKIDPKDDKKFSYLWAAHDLLERASKVVIATDNDAPGDALAEELARRIGKAKCWRVMYPSGCKDANDVLKLHGEAGLREIWDKAEPWPVAGLYDADHYVSAVHDLYEKGQSSGISTGINAVDELYTVVPGQVSIVTGIPGSGKSEFIDQLACNLAEMQNWKIAICSFENPPHLHISKLIEKRMRKPFHHGNPGRMTRDEWRTGQQWVNDHFHFIEQSDGQSMTIESILERARISVLRHGCRGLIIDPYNYIHRPRDSSETQWVSDMLSDIRRFAIAHDVHVWFVAHPQKLQRFDGSVPVPGGYDISGSAAWYAKADMGVTVHRASEPNLTLVRVWKVRFKWAGSLGDAYLAYDPKNGTYTDGRLTPIEITVGKETTTRDD